MNKEILDTLDDLSKRPTTELAMRLMETTVDNMAKDKELDKYKNIVDELETYLQRKYCEYVDMESDDAFVISLVLDTLRELIRRIIYENRNTKRIVK